MRKLFLLMMVSVFVISACNKEKDYTSDGNATILVMNGAVNVPSIMIGMNGKLNTSATTTTKVNYGSAAFWYAERKPIDISIYKGTDTTILKTSNYNLSNGKIYSLFVGGDLTNVEPVFVEETNFPYIRLDRTPPAEDSLIHVRFVNLSPNAGAIKVNIQGSSNSEVGDLSYKGYSTFKAYAAKPSNSSYVFEFRDATTNALLYQANVIPPVTPIPVTSTLQVNATNRFKNVAIVLRGMRDLTSNSDPNRLQVSTINYFQ